MFSRNTYIKRRNILSKNLKNGFVLLLGHQNSPMNFSHNAYRFVQDTNFLYYAGVDLPNCACLIDVENNIKYSGNFWSILLKYLLAFKWC